MARLVCYETCGQGPTQGFMGCLASFECTAEVIRNCWLIETNQSCVAIRDMFRPHLGNGDRLFVVAVCREAAWAGGTVSPVNTVRNILKSCSC